MLQSPAVYKECHRVLGIYRLATLPYSIASNRWPQETVGMFRRAAAHLKRYAKPRFGGTIGRYRLHIGRFYDWVLNDLRR